MLSAFPFLLSYQQLSPLLIRLVLAAVFIFWSYKGLRTTRIAIKLKGLAILEGVVGILILIGLFTQVAALVVLVDMIVRIIGKIKDRTFLTDGVNYYLILLILSLSLMLTGAGFVLAIDLPL